MNTPNIRFIKFKSPLPFDASEKQIIYVEDEYNSEMNQFIEKNYKEISDFFSSRGHAFAYIPIVQKNIQKDSDSFVSYFYPDIPLDLSSETKNISAQNIYNSLFSFLIDEKEPLKPGFIQYKSTKNNVHSFLYLRINFISENDLLVQIKSYFRYVRYIEEDDIVHCCREVSFEPSCKYELPAKIKYESPSKERSTKPSKKPKFINGIKRIFNKEELKLFKDDLFESDYCRIEEPKIEIADIDFPVEAVRIIEEIRLKISYLTQIGINEWVLQELFTSKTTQKLSKLLITKDFRIILQDYNNREIHLTPLPKAVFLLFLNYPDGIMFKHLSDHKDELMNIYLKLSNRENIGTMEKSIDDLVDPTKNAINEKCSRIREAFIKEFDIRLAENYFITGERFSPKRITLSRDLVRWESKV